MCLTTVNKSSTIILIMATFKEVDASRLEALGVIDVMRTPADGVDRNTWISWKTARLAVRASFHDYRGEPETPEHQIVVNNADGKDHSIAFSTEVIDNGIVRIATVSGWHQEARAKLSPEQSEVFRSLVEASIALGLISFR